MGGLTIVSCGMSARLEETLAFALDGVSYQRVNAADTLPELSQCARTLCARAE